MQHQFLYSAYVVLWIQSGRIIYAGPSECHAAMALEPGTTYGTGFSHERALSEATTRREFHSGAQA